MGNHKLYLYPVWIRLWHVINALLCLILIITGFVMHFETIFFDFETTVKVHNVAGVILLANYLIFIFGNLVTTNGNHYTLECKGLFKRIFVQIRYYSFGVFKGEETPYPTTEANKFNPVQQITYTMIMYGLLPILGLTGVALLYPENILFNVLNIEGIVLIDIIHLIGGFFILVFLIIHIYFSTMGEKISTHFKSIINGWH